jgi:transketolase
MYIRLGKAGEKTFHNEDIKDYQIGDLLPIIKNSDAKTLVLTSGSVIDNVVSDIHTKSLDYDVYSIPVVKPINKKQLCNLVTNYNQIIVVEEHQKSCGIGSAVIEVVSDAYNEGELLTYPKIERKAIDDVFFSVVGNQKYLRKLAGLNL